MNRNFKIIFSIILGLSIFFVLLKGLESTKKYSPLSTSNKIDLNIYFQSLFDEKEYSIRELADKKNFILINIWSSWCLPCREEHSYLMKLKKNNINLIGVNYKDNSNNAKVFIKEMGNPYTTILVDVDGTKSIELGAIGVPETYLVDSSESKVLKKYIGPLDQKKLEEIIYILKK